jgi:hypothetical protein
MCPVAGRAGWWSFQPPSNPEFDTRKRSEPGWWNERGQIADPERRGRLASKPSDIPARGWKDILWRVYENVTIIGS